MRGIDLTDELSRNHLAVPAQSDVWPARGERLLAHPVALLRGCDADPPRNLAQSVTVE